MEESRVKCADVVVGTKFPSFEAAKQCITAYGKQRFVHFYVRDSRTIAAAVKKTARNINPKLKYYQLKFACIHGGRNFKSRGARKRQNRTLQQDCPSHIYLRADNEGESLEVLSMSDVHSHEVSKELFRYLPQERVRPHDFKTKAKKLLQLKVNKKKLKVHMQEASDKIVTLRDLSNLTASNEDPDTNNVEKCVKLLEEKYFADTRILLQGSMFMGLTFCTPGMKKVVENYPEILCVDATYKLLNISLPVYIIAAEDGNGETEVVCVGILVNEEKETMQWFINAFKDMNPNSVNVKTIMTGKDLSERSSLKSIFPGASLLIYIFDTLRTFSHEITCQKMGITSAQRLSAIEFFQKITLTRDARFFEKLVQNLKHHPQPVVQYFEKNWENIKNEWAISHGFQNLNFLNTTNNRLENLNRKLKNVLRSYSSLEEFINLFFVAINVQQSEIDHRVAVNILTRPVLFIVKDSVEEKYYNYLTKYAYDKVKHELDKAKDVKMCTPPNNENACIKVKCSHMLFFCSANKCSCSFRASTMLPCRHIFAIREHLNLDRFVPQLCYSRWSKSLHQSTNRIFSNGSSSNAGSIHYSSAHPQRKPLSQRKKFKRAIIPLYRIAVLISESCGTEYEQKMKHILDLADEWESQHNAALNSPHIVDQNLPR